MKTYTIDGGTYAKMIGAGASRLNEYRKTVNDLNVFPIPDGDTGDNMYMTISAGWEAIGAPDSLEDAAGAAARGMLLGARGNSGVILSRIFAGIAKGLDGCREAIVEDFRNAMRSGVAESYDAVSTPVEGTMLTVFREAVEAAEDCTDTFEEYFEALCKEAGESLERTPSLLDVLAHAGVVDSGGAGLLYILEGMKEALDPEAEFSTAGSGQPAAAKVDLSAFTEDSVLEFGYCTEFLLRLQRSKLDLDTFDEKEIIDYLNSVGESVVAFRDGSIVKVHVHTMTPGDILNHCQRWGEYLTIKIENMTLQHHETHKEAPRRPRRKAAVVTVASGDGLVQVLTDMGADAVIRGGQTMNPSASDFVKAFEEVNADNIYVLPNNSNIILTAGQAAEMFEGSQVCVLPSKSIGAGYTLLGSIDFSASTMEEVEQQAADILEDVVTGMVSRAIRDTADAAEGDWIGFVKDDILCSGKDRTEVLHSLCDKLGAASSDVVLVFSGADVAADESCSAQEKLQAAYASAEVVMCDGGQPVFDYIVVIQ